MYCCKANACLSRRSATKPDVPRDRLWESMGDYGRVWEAGKARCSRLTRRVIFAAHAQCCYGFAASAATHTVARVGGNTPILSHTFLYFPIHSHTLPYSLIKSRHQPRRRACPDQKKVRPVGQVGRVGQNKT